MTDRQRVDAFFARLLSDPNFASFAILLGPHRALMGDSAVVETIEALIEHWQATAPQEQTA